MSNQIHSEWNNLSQEQRFIYLEWAEMLIRRGYLQNEDPDRDITRVAFGLFANHYKNKSPLPKDHVNQQNNTIRSLPDF